jgi:hypothetical protein
MVQTYRRMLDFIREFKFGRPQQIAALLLVAFIVLVGSYQLLHVHFQAVGIFANVGPEPPIFHGQILTPIWIGLSILRLPMEAKVFLPALAFGLSLGGALWWVTRRLYDDEGGYVALALFCFSLPMIHYSALLRPDIVAAWGLYGLIYTAIGVAHTLYAPPRKWRPRIVLLGIALGVTAGAYFAAALVGLIFAIGFMLYLAPGRRKEALGIIAIACGIAVVFVVALYGFDLHAFTTAITSKEAWAISVHRGDPVVSGPQWLLLGVFTLAALITYAAWKRTRYFGNTTPLLVMAALFMLHHDGAQAVIWALPFAFTFIGGIFADLLETPGRKIVAWSLGSALAGYAALAIAAVLAVPK